MVKKNGEETKEKTRTPPKKGSEKGEKGPKSVAGGPVWSRSLGALDELLWRLV